MGKNIEEICDKSFMWGFLSGILLTLIISLII
jgi:hypothetical protein